MKNAKPHGITHVTHGSVFDDAALFDPARGAELKMRAQLLRGLERWLQDTCTQNLYVGSSFPPTSQLLRRATANIIEAIDTRSRCHDGEHAEFASETESQ